jgi:hypothetical protein
MRIGWVVRVGVVAGLVVAALEVRSRHLELASLGNGVRDREQALARSERDLDDLERDVEFAAGRLHDLDALVTAREREHPDGIPEGEYREYRELLGERNAAAADYNALLAHRESLTEAYRQDVARHNGEVARANALAAHSTPWSVVGDWWDGASHAMR